MLNLSSNDYLGLASRQDLQEEFQASTQDRFYPYSSSSSRLLTGNFSVYTKLEKQIARSFDREAALIFNSGYHANTGILPALTDKQTLLLRRQAGARQHHRWHLVEWLPIPPLPPQRL